ncbi:MAG: Holliday junction branch migration protein RuvA [Bacteroidales bacterium]
MFEFIEGKIVEKTPAHLVLQEGGVGYYINISLFTFTGLPNEGIIRIFIHQVIREDANILFGFRTKEEREIFRQLISVSGIGANTARVILSSMTPDEVAQSIMEGNVSALQAIKGIGGKTAQRIIVDLKDKIAKGVNIDDLFLSERNTIRDEALSALVALGFAKKQAEKVVGKLLSQQPKMEVEDVVKQALKLL